jgi:hypothetical protein
MTETALPAHPSKAYDLQEKSCEVEFNYNGKTYIFMWAVFEDGSPKDEVVYCKNDDMAYTYEWWNEMLENNRAQLTKA